MNNILERNLSWNFKILTQYLTENNEERHGRGSVRTVGLQAKI
jgi:hypothetical protein